MVDFRKIAGIAAIVMVGGGALAAGLPFDFVHFGSFRRMAHTGDVSGQVAIQDLPQQAGSWGVGATAGLMGEITQINGQVLVTPGSDPQGRTRTSVSGEQATLFASGRVAEWRDIAVPEAMDQATLERFVTEQAERAGVSLTDPFVFRIEGSFPKLIWHVVTGERKAGGGHGAPGHQPAPVSGHANQQSGLRIFHQPGAQGQLIGVYSGPTLEGIVSHPGERFHVHYADGAAGTSGHVDAYAVAAGAILKLPIR